MRDSSTSLNPSIAPSDLISRNGSASRTSRSGRSTPYSAGSRRSEPRPQPATRPSEYPEEILWSLDDCKADPDVKVSSTNSSRPPMERAIRHPDGAMISASEWAAIKATARMVKADLLSLPPPRDRCARERTKSKIYFRTYFRKEWDAAVAKMESHQPLLALCASHWKAEHVLGNTLLVKVPEKPETDNSESPMETTNTSPRSKGKKRARKRHSHDKKRQKKDGQMPKAVSGEAGSAAMDIGKSFTDTLLRHVLTYLLSTYTWTAT